MLAIRCLGPCTTRVDRIKRAVGASLVLHSVLMAPTFASALKQFQTKALTEPDRREDLLEEMETWVNDMEDIDVSNSSRELSLVANNRV